MKKSIQLLAVICILLAWQSCGNNPKDASAEAASKEQAIAEKAEKQEALIAKRARIEKIRLEKAEQRRIVAVAKASSDRTYVDSKGKTVYNKAETDPSYLGGDRAISKYLKDNLVYPQVALDKGVEGTVFVDFVVDQYGKVTDVEAKDAAWEDVDQTLMDEAIRIVTSMPNWVAGRQHGAPVSTRFSIPITFQLTQ